MTVRLPQRVILREEGPWAVAITPKRCALRGGASLLPSDSSRIDYRIGETRVEWRLIDQKLFLLLEPRKEKTVQRIMKMLARGFGLASLATLLAGGSTTTAAPVEKPESASFQAPAKRLVLDYSRVALKDHAHLQALTQRNSHHSHYSHGSHHSHYSAR